MLMLLFQVADEPWAIAAAEVKDLIPLVSLQPYTGGCLPANESLLDESLLDESVVDESVVDNGGVNKAEQSLEEEALAEGALLKDALVADRSAARIAGLLNYHGEYVPVVDVAQSIAQQRAPLALSTRIAIVEMDRGGGASPRKRGLILDRAYETAYLSKSVGLPVNSPYVNATLEGPAGIVQQLAIAKLF